MRFALAHIPLTDADDGRDGQSQLMINGKALINEKQTTFFDYFVARQFNCIKRINGSVTNKDTGQTVLSRIETKDSVNNLLDLEQHLAEYINSL